MVARLCVALVIAAACRIAQSQGTIVSDASITAPLRFDGSAIKVVCELSGQKPSDVRWAAGFLLSRRGTGEPLLRQGLQVSDGIKWVKWNRTPRRTDPIDVPIFVIPYSGETIYEWHDVQHYNPDGTPDYVEHRRGNEIPQPPVFVIGVLVVAHTIKDSIKCELTPYWVHYSNRKRGSIKALDGRASAVARQNLWRVTDKLDLKLLEKGVESEFLTSSGENWGADFNNPVSIKDYNIKSGELARIVGKLVEKSKGVPLRFYVNDKVLPAKLEK